MKSLLGIELFCVALFIGVLLFLEIGRRIGARKSRNVGAGSGGWGAVEGAMFALLGLLIAFTFSGAATRFDARRQLIVHEANAISTAYLRLDLLPAGAQPPLRDAFRRYVEARLDLVRALPDMSAAVAAIDRATALQGEIWSQAVAACREAGAAQTTMLLLPALNEMIDMAATRTVSMTVHQPVIVLAMVAVLALVCSLLSGYDLTDRKSRSWVHMLCFAGILAATMYVILDLEYPRMGLIRLDAADQVMVDVRTGMNPIK